MMVIFSSIHEGKMWLYNFVLDLHKCLKIIIYKGLPNASIDHDFLG